MAWIICNIHTKDNLSLNKIITVSLHQFRVKWLKIGVFDEHFSTQQKISVSFYCSTYIDYKFTVLWTSIFSINIVVFEGNSVKKSRHGSGSNNDKSLNSKINLKRNSNKTKKVSLEYAIAKL